MLKLKNKEIPSLQTRNMVLSIILIVSSIIAFLLMVLPEYFDNQGVQISVGEASSEDILAPYSINFESKVLTDRAKQNAANAIEDVYLVSDPSIARKQLNILDAALSYITTIKNDPLSSYEQKVEDLMAMQHLQLTENDLSLILLMDMNDWQAVGIESARVLESVLRENLRESQVERIKSNLSNTIKFSFKLEQTQVTQAIVSQLIVPTSPYSAEETQKAREYAMASVQPITRQIIAGEAIVRRGEILAEADMEALNVFGLTTPADQTNTFIKNGVVILISALLVLSFFRYRATETMMQPLAMILVAIFFLLFLGIARFLVMGNIVWPYLYPLAAFGLTISIIFNFELGSLLSLLLAFLSVFGFGRGSELLIFYGKLLYIG